MWQCENENDIEISISMKYESAQHIFNGNMKAAKYLKASSARNNQPSALAAGNRRSWRKLNGYLRWQLAAQWRMRNSIISRRRRSYENMKAISQLMKCQ